MSLNGRFVVFESFANNLAGGRPSATRSVPASDIFLHDRDTDEDGVFDETGEHRHAARQRQSVRHAADQPQHRAVDHLRRQLRGVRDRGRQRQGRRELRRRSTATRARDIYIWDRLGDPPTLRRLSEPSDGSDLPGASGAPVLSGNGNLLLFRTQAVNAGGASVARRDRRRRRRATASRRRARCRRRPPTRRRRRRAAAAAHRQHRGPVDERRRQHHRQHDRARSRHRRGRAGGRARRDAARRRRHAVHRRPVARRPGPTAGGAIVDIQGANFVSGPDDGAVGRRRPSPSPFVSSVAAAGHRADGVWRRGRRTVRVIVNGEASNEVQYTYVDRPDRAVDHVVQLRRPGRRSPAAAVTITGTGFSNPSVRFGPNGASVTSSNANSITVHDSGRERRRAGADHRHQQQRRGGRVEHAVHLHVRAGQRRRRSCSR